MQDRPAEVLKVLSWNVNGLRAAVLKSFGTLQTFIERLDADVICLQETKLREQELCRELAILEGWDSFFTCAQSTRGYSGVATFVRTHRALPLSAEAGFSGAVARVALERDFTPEELAELDSEGRVMATDLGEFVLFNCYCPAITSSETAEARMSFKMRFFKALQARWEDLLRQGRRVVVVGDINVCPSPLDQPEAEADFYRPTRPDRLWLRSLLRSGAPAPGGSGSGDGAGPGWTDVFRAFHPSRKGAFTCWSTATAARVNNYGSRIDLVLAAGLPLATPGAAAAGGRLCITACDISPEVHGSDHCPVWFVAQSSGPFPCAAAAPPSSTRFTFAGKQLKLHAWLQQQTGSGSGGGALEAAPSGRQGPGVPAAADAGAAASAAAPGVERQEPQGQQQTQQPPGASAGDKRQASLHGFVRRGSSAAAEEDSGGPGGPVPPGTLPGATLDLPSELAAAHSLRQEGIAAAKEAWGRIQQRMAVPNCNHREPAVVKKVNKSGPNSGRYFHTCARPEGPAPHGKCQFFVWVEKRKGEGSSSGAGKRTKQ